MIETNIIQRCQQGDEEAYAELYKALYKKALWTAYLISNNMDTAEDVIQEAFFECFRSINKLKKYELFPVWFNKILMRTCWRIVLKEKKKLSNSFDDEILTEVASDNNDFERIEANQTRLMIRKEINKLSPPMRMTIVLYYYNEMTVKEIAKVMNCLEGTVKSRMYYAKRVLGNVLKKEMFEDSFEYLSCHKTGGVLDGQK